MARIEPFRAWRPRPEVAERVASPPYDVLSSDEARDTARDNPLSFLHVVKPEIDLAAGVDLYSDQVYAKGAENLSRLKDDGILIREATPAFYLYRQRMGDHVQTGLVTGASVDEYEADLIKKHEHTRPKKEDDRTRHVEALGANTGPVFLTYRSRPEIDVLIDRLTSVEPTYDFTAPDGIQHVLWVVDQTPDVQALQTAFAAVPELYVADGHHRSAAATRVRALRRERNPEHTGEEPYNFFLSVIFPHDQMLIMDYNRVVKLPPGLDREGFLAKVHDAFEVTPGSAEKPDRARCFGMYIGGTWFRLVAKPGTFPDDDPVRSLDVAVLQDNLLGPVLGIDDPRSDENIDFVGGIRGLSELERRVDSGAWDVAFALYPTAIEQLFAVADAGRVMPPKSTWFEPKLRSGLIVRPLDD
jgi:uncharacterized protein (DUF1015 family)